MLILTGLLIALTVAGFLGVVYTVMFREKVLEFFLKWSWFKKFWEWSRPLRRKLGASEPTGTVENLPPRP